MNFKVNRSNAAKIALLPYALASIVLCATTAVQQADGQSPNGRDVSGTTWECRIDSSNVDAAGRLTGTHSEDHVRITFNPGGSSVSAKFSDPPNSSADNGRNDWSFGEWKQEGATVRSVSNGTVESFHAQPWKEGDAEKMMELKISGNRMQGKLLSHSRAESVVFQCQRQDPLPDASSPRNTTSSSGSRPVSGFPDIDVRVSSADSRLLTEAEMAGLRDSLHWEPESAPLPRGGAASAYLVDRQERKLGSIRVQWTRAVVPKVTSSQPGGPAVGSFILEMTNGTSCGFLGQAELDDPKGLVIVSSLDLDAWVGLGQPGSGETIRVEGDADLPNPIPRIVFKPLAAGSALSACLTPKEP